MNFSQIKQDFVFNCLHAPLTETPRSASPNNLLVQIVPIDFPLFTSVWITNWQY